MKSETIRILLVDDDKEEYFLINDLVEDFELYKVELEWIDNYDDAVVEIAKENHDVYLLDYRLGAHTGIDILRQLSDSELLNNSIYVFLTGYGNSKVDKEALEKGADDFLSKGELSVQILERTIRYGLERKRAFIELKKSQNQYKQIYLNTKTPVIELDLDMNVIKVNGAFNETFKYSENFVIDPETQKLKVWELLDCDTIQERVITHILNKKAKSAEVFECNNQQKEVLLVQMNVYELVNANGKKSYQIVLNDLTEKVTKDQEMYKRQKLDLMERMARIVAHEVRNPLTNIILSSEQLLPVLAEKDVMYAEIIRRNSNRIEELIRKFLNTFKHAELVKKTDSVEETIYESIQNFADKAKLLEVELCIKIDVELPPAFFDREKILLVINNLVNNAMQACEARENGKITVSAEKQNGAILIHITDNGVGISEDDMTKLFEPFFTKKSSGLGLGLTTSLNIMKSHNGGVVATANKTEGATFSISIPIEDDSFH